MKAQSKIALVLCGLCFSAIFGLAEAQEVMRQFKTANGTDTIFYKDGSASATNGTMRFNLTEQWKKEGSKICVDWKGRGGMKQCY